MSIVPFYPTFIFTSLQVSSIFHSVASCFKGERGEYELRVISLSVFAVIPSVKWQSAANIFCSSLPLPLLSQVCFSYRHQTPTQTPPTLSHAITSELSPVLLQLIIPTSHSHLALLPQGALGLRTLATTNCHHGPTRHTFGRYRQRF